MATLQVPIPDNRVNRAILAVARRMIDHSDSTVAALAQRIVDGGSATAAEKNALGTRFCQDQIKSAWEDLEASDVAIAARAAAKSEVW
jgi:hypothetical protein